MVKIWAKALKKDKIQKDVMYKLFEKFDKEKFMEYLVDICYELDIPTPILLNTHINHFDKFNIVRFKETDFVESIDFDVLMLENASD